MIMYNRRIIHIITLCGILIAASAYSQSVQPVKVTFEDKKYELYPRTYSEPPDLPSPAVTEGGVETMTACTKYQEYALIPVTVENDSLGFSFKRHTIGKGKQLDVDAEDFPALSETGLHSETELDAAKTITGKSIEEITGIARPGQSSGAGFICYDEDIISVLKGDNRLVKKLGMTHPQMAKPLFHIWNLILLEYKLGNIRRYWDNIEYVVYNGKKVRFGEVFGTKGFQESIFNDEIKGSFQINFRREIDKDEKTYLNQKYSHLNQEQMAELKKRLSHILTGEMEPYYIMRYGFYEGHTSYRTDPIALSFIFGLKKLEDIDRAVDYDLYNALTTHYNKDSLTK